jgi:hypothetical protein
MGACSSSTEPPADPEGLTLTESGLPLVIVTGTNVSGSLSIDIGRTSPPMVITFTDSEGTSVKTKGRYLDVTVADSRIAVFDVTEASAFTGQLSGKEAGNTTLRFRLMDGEIGSGTLVYESPPIPVTVEGMV